MAAIAAILKIYLENSSPEPEGLLTRNLVGSIVTTFIAFIVPRWLLWQPSRNIFLASSSVRKGQLTRNFVGCRRTSGTWSSIPQSTSWYG